MKVIERRQAVDYLRDHNLIQQYKKAKQYIEQGLFEIVRLKKRNPKSSGIWYFRITKKYRALCTRVDDVLIVFDISDHQ